MSAYNAEDPGSVPGLGRSLGGGNGNPLQYSCLENPMDRGAWRATVHGVAKSQTQLSDFTFTFTHGVYNIYGATLMRSVAERGWRGGGPHSCKVSNSNGFYIEYCDFQTKQM